MFALTPHLPPTPSFDLKPTLDARVSCVIWISGEAGFAMRACPRRAKTLAAKRRQNGRANPSPTWILGDNSEDEERETRAIEIQRSRMIAPGSQNRMKTRLESHVIAADLLAPLRQREPSRTDPFSRVRN